MPGEKLRVAESRLFIRTGEYAYIHTVYQVGDSTSSGASLTLETQTRMKAEEDELFGRKKENCREKLSCGISQGAGDK